MNCNDILTFFQRVEENKGQILALTAGEQDILNFSLQKQFLASRSSIDTDFNAVLKLREKYESVKKQLFEFRSDKNYLKKNWDLKDQYDLLTKSEKEIRSEIISKTESNSTFQSAVNINGIYYYITYIGKELLNNMLIRKEYLSQLSLDEFLFQLREIVDYFDSTSRRAFSLIQLLLERSIDFDDVFLNSLVFSLALVPGVPNQIIDNYIFTSRRLLDQLQNPEFFSYVGEIILINNQNVNFSSDTLINKFIRIYSELTKFSIKNDEKITIATVFLPLIEDDISILNKIMMEGQDAATDFVNLNAEFSGKLIPFVILSTFYGSLDQSSLNQFNEIYLRLNTTTKYNESIAIAAAMVLTVNKGIDELIDRCITIRNYLNRFGEDGMTLPALMLSQIPLSIEELLDIIRTASNQILKYFQNISGFENMTLDIKMILQSSYNPNFNNKSINMIDSKPIVQVPPLGRPMSPFMTGPVPMRIRPMMYSTMFYSGIGVRSTRNYYNSYHFHPMHTHYMQG